MKALTREVQTKCFSGRNIEFFNIFALKKIKKMNKNSDIKIKY